MFYADTSRFSKHPNYAAIREKYEATKPWRGTDDRPVGGRRQRWARLTKVGETYAVTAWGAPLLTYRPDGVIDVHVSRSHNSSAQGVLREMLPWVMPWGCSTSWLMLHARTMSEYPHYTPWYTSTDEPIVVAVKGTADTVSLREFDPTIPLRTSDELFENAARDLVGIPMFTANMEARRAAYTQYDLPAFGAWARAYLQLVTPQTINNRHSYVSRWGMNHSMPRHEVRLAMLCDPAQWPALVGDPSTLPYPVQRAALLVELLREDIQRELGVDALHVTHYQSLPLSRARTAHQQRSRTRHMLGGTDLHPVPYADALPQPIVATATNTTTPTEVSR